VTFGLEGLWISVDSDDDNFERSVGTFTPAGGGPAVELFSPVGQDNENEFFVARAKLNFKFGTY
jgi:outer membrane immunogenic protein